MAWYGWQNLHDLFLSDIIMMIGQESLKDIQKCRQVCKGWNVWTNQLTKLKKDKLRRNFEIEAAAIRVRWSGPHHTPALPEILTAASLAHQGILGSLECFVLEDVDLGSIPVEQLAPLVSCVERDVEMERVTGDLGTILDHIHCGLSIYNPSLSSEETLALVKAMESNVEELRLWWDFNIDIEALTDYSGQGKCRKISCVSAGDKTTGNEIERWAKSNNWLVYRNGKYVIIVERIIPE